MTDEASLDGLRIRPAARALVVDPDDRVLLVRFEFPAGTRWALPGGGIEPGETPEEAIRRELVDLAAAGRVKSHVSRRGPLTDLPAIFDELESAKYLGRAVIDDLGR